eukprot:TRINITY_DN19968_c0_g1_i1.p1 TRINITY_DN19968_c0_g1~~TRINITY_DN19968_c0_g1_i1.p1  ORF type:complete len:753 (-),score=97.38 TRINITY_DN19968_c0_g1_i1:358-2616(-)
MQLRILVAGDTNSGKSSLINALLGRDLLPVSCCSETSLITYIRAQADIYASPVLCTYIHGDHASDTFHPQLEGDAEIRARLKHLNQFARVSGKRSCLECCINCPLRSSLNEVFVPAGAEWENVQFLDIGGTDEELNPAVLACADLAYAMSHRLIVCIKYDQVTTTSTRRLVEEIRCKVPYHFNDELANREVCPLIFLITQVDKVLGSHNSVASEDLEAMRQRLRALLHSTLHDCPELVQAIPILTVSAAQSLLPHTGANPFEWDLLEEHLILWASLKRDIVQQTKLRRAAFIQRLIESYQTCICFDWPFIAQSLWNYRRDAAVKLGLGSTVAVASVGTAIAFGVYLSAATAASVSASEAAAATAVSNSAWAWLFGFGSYGAAASSAQASAAGAAATANAWGIGAFSGAAITVSSSGAALAYEVTEKTTSASSHLSSSHILGMKVATTENVGARDARMALRPWSFQFKAEQIRSGETYRDILFYPEGIVRFTREQDLSNMAAPFKIQHAKSGSFLSHSNGQVGCSSRSDRVEQLWWAVASGEPSSFVLQSAELMWNLRTEVSQVPFDKRMAISCSAEVPGQLWRLRPGSSEGTFRLYNVARETYLYYDGWSTGCWHEQFPDQDWVIVPKLPCYVGDFVGNQISGEGEFFWPNGAPSFKGSVSKGKLKCGFVFDERYICHGHFKLDDVVELDGMQPDDIDTQGNCPICKEGESIRLIGMGTKPCGHGVVCSACAGRVRECPCCHAPVCGTMRVA